MTPRFAIASLALLIGALLSWMLIRQPEGDPKESPEGSKTTSLPPLDPKDPNSRRVLREPSPRGPEFDPNAIPNERIVTFRDEQSYRDFLARLDGSGVRLLRNIDALRAVHLGFDKLSDFDALGLDPDEVQFNYAVSIPELRELPPQEGLVGFGNNVLSYLGVTGDNSTWGQGVKIAVIDTGITPHLTLSGNIEFISLVDLPEGTLPHSHGTSVASLIAGTHPNMRGVAPGADLISVQVADETGFSTSVLLAEGIVAAVDAGAQLINISMGSNGDSLLVRQAVDYARERGAAVFASAGNDGSPKASAPARDPDVFSVGAVDANGTHLNFSSSDQDLAFTAPGLEVQAAYPGDNVTPFTGTSAAVAFPVGAVAAIMSQSGNTLTPQQAVDVLRTHSNEAGLPGQDPQFGHGIIDLGRALNRNTPGITDLAVASHNYLLPTPTDSSSGLQVSIENRGTETVFGATLDIEIGGDRFPYTVHSLRPNERSVITIPAGQTQLMTEGSLRVGTRVNLPDQGLDAQPGNDQRREVIFYQNGQDDGP